MPKSTGGLGLHKTAATNKAFQCNLAWEVRIGACLWVQVELSKVEPI